MTDTLTGEFVGPDRQQIVARVRETAAAYFGTPCVFVLLGLATVTGDADAPEFRVPFDAQEHHDMEHMSYGADRCRGCGAPEWPGDLPLPRSPLANSG